jgi:hypothetical protein
VPYCRRDDFEPRPPGLVHYTRGHLALRLEDILRCAMRHKHLVNFRDERDEFAPAAILLEITAEVGGESQFTVTESAGASPSADHVARAALDTLGGAALNWADSFVYVASLVQQKHTVPPASQLARRKKTGRPSPNYCRVIWFLHIPMISQGCYYFRVSIIIHDNIIVIVYRKPQ